MMGDMEHSLEIGALTPQLVRNGSRMSLDSIESAESNMTMGTDNSSVSQEKWKHIALFFKVVDSKATCTKCSKTLKVQSGSSSNLKVHYQRCHAAYHNDLKAALDSGSRRGRHKSFQDMASTRRQASIEETFKEKFSQKCLDIYYSRPGSTTTMSASEEEEGPRLGISSQGYSQPAQDNVPLDSQPLIFQYIERYYGPCKNNGKMKCKLCFKEIRYKASYYNLKSHYLRRHCKEYPNLVAALSAGSTKHGRQSSPSGSCTKRKSSSLVMVKKQLAPMSKAPPFIAMDLGPERLDSSVQIKTEDSSCVKNEEERESMDVQIGIVDEYEEQIEDNILNEEEEMKVEIKEEDDLSWREDTEVTSDEEDSQSSQEEEEEAIPRTMPLKAAAAKKKQTRHRSDPVHLPPATESELADWVQDHPELYNKNLSSFKETAKKNCLLQEKAASLELDCPITATDLKTWLKSIRAKFGKLTKPKSSGVVRVLSERDHWITERFGFLKDHIVRHQGHTMGCTNTEEVLPGTSTQHSEEVAENSQVAPEGTGTRRRLVDPETPGPSSRRSKGNPVEMTLLEKLVNAVSSSHDMAEAMRTESKNKDGWDQWSQYLATKARALPPGPITNAFQFFVMGILERVRLRVEAQHQTVAGAFQGIVTASSLQSYMEDVQLPAFVPASQPLPLPSQYVLPPQYTHTQTVSQPVTVASVEQARAILVAAQQQQQQHQHQHQQQQQQRQQQQQQQAQAPVSLLDFNLSLSSNGPVA